MLEIPSGLDDGQSRWTVTCFDNMANHGSAGGKHGGQALSPNCLNWCELPAYDLTGDQAFKMGRGGTFLGLSVAGDGCGIGGGVGENGVLLKKGQEVNVRRSYYSGGLAGYIELAKAVDEVPWQ